MAEYTDIRFPAGFYWGCATASHQVEGNCTKNDWWAWEQEGGHIHEGGVSGIACDHYNRFEEDFALAQELGHNAHRLSIEWSRIEPEEGQWDMAEVDHYRRVMESLHRHGLTPFVTLHHFTNPLWFRDRGGWLNPQAPDLIARYAGFIAKELGDLVPFWFTINEPMVIVTASYLVGNWPPQHKDMAEAMVAARHLLLAHAPMYQAIKESTTHSPQVGVVLTMPYFEPKTLTRRATAPRASGRRRLQPVLPDGHRQGHLRAAGGPGRGGAGCEGHLGHHRPELLLVGSLVSEDFLTKGA